MELSCDARICRHRVDQLAGSVLRMARHKANDVISLDLANSRKKVCKITFSSEFLTVGVDVLTEQGNLSATACDKLAHLTQNILGTAAAFSASDVRNDTVRAEIVTAVHNADPSLIGILTQNGDSLHRDRLALVRAKASLLRGHHAVKDLGHLPELLRAEGKINIGIASLDTVDGLLFGNHAAGNADDQRRIFRFQMLIATRDGKRSLLRVITHGAGIDDDDVSVLLFIGLFITHRLQHTRNALTVRFVLLTAVRYHARLLDRARRNDITNFICIFNLLLHLLRSRVTRGNIRSFFHINSPFETLGHSIP